MNCSALPECPRFESSILYWFWPVGLLTMIGRIITFIDDVRRVVTDFTLLLTSPTSIMAALGLLLQFGAAALIAILVPFTVRTFMLPSSIEVTVPLNLVFDACEDQMHAICSFPTATLDVHENTIFSPNVYYALTVKLQFAEVESTKKLGLFQNVLRVYGDDDILMREYLRTSYIREPSIVKKATWLFFLPLYICGFFTTAAQLDIPVTMEHFENPSNPTSRLFFQLQNRFAEVETAELAVTAQFGLIRHLLYYYPISTFALMWLPTFLFLSLALFVNWGMRVTREVTEEMGNKREKRRRESISTTASISEMEVEETKKMIEERKKERKSVERQKNDVIVEEVEREDSQLTPSSSRSSTSYFDDPPSTEDGLKRDAHKAADEFIPDNVEELPECVPPFIIDGLTSLGPDEKATVPPPEYGSGDGPRKRR